jgi:glycosyltransferase involved in cell wall biosynthesis
MEMTTDALRTYCVIPSYRAGETIVSVVAEALRYADVVVVVDDACPEKSGPVARAAYAGNPAVHVIEREANGGVGAAMKTGIGFAIEAGADVIVKVDADGQMDPSFIPLMVGLFADDPSLVAVKGNRFFQAQVLQTMPKARLFGNAVLSLMAKFASGYWNTIDPTNGYLAFKAPLLELLPWQNFADSYFFEMSVLCELGLRRLPLVELEMPTIYTEAPSSLSIWRVIVDFPPRLFVLTLRRWLLQYFVFDVNLGSLYAVAGSFLLLFSVVFGAYEWVESYLTHIGRATGTVMLVVLTFLMGFQLLLNALMCDVQFSRGTRHELLVSARAKSKT